MNKEYIDGLYGRLEAELAAAAPSGGPTDFGQLSASLEAVRGAMGTLREHVTKHPFPSEAEEIHFFKHVKPRFYSHHIHALEWYGIATAVPAGDAAMQRKFYRGELRAIRRFFRQIGFHYGYYRLGATELDSLYFVRGVEVQTVLIPEVPETDPAFSTSCDYLFAKIMAYERLRESVARKLSELDKGRPPAARTPERPDVAMKWTGEQVNLVELIYGIYLTGQVNHGNAEVREIKELFERMFGIELKMAYHKFGDIRRRKSISPTRFLDQMREAVLKRIEEDLEYVPDRGVRLKNRLRDHREG